MTVRAWFDLAFSLGSVVVTGAYVAALVMSRRLARREGIPMGEAMKRNPAMGLAFAIFPLIIGGRGLAELTSYFTAWPGTRDGWQGIALILLFILLSTTGAIMQFRNARRILSTREPLTDERAERIGDKASSAAFSTVMLVLLGRFCIDVWYAIFSNLEADPWRTFWVVATTNPYFLMLTVGGLVGAVARLHYQRKLS